MKSLTDAHQSSPYGASFPPYTTSKRPIALVEDSSLVPPVHSESRRLGVGLESDQATFPGRYGLLIEPVLHPGRNGCRIRTTGAGGHWDDPGRSPVACSRHAHRGWLTQVQAAHASQA